MAIYRFPDEYPEILVMMGQIICEHLEKMAVEDVYPKAFAITEQFRIDCGGIAQYIPKGRSYALSARDTEIYRKFKGNNYFELSREYNLSEQQIRNIINDCLAFERAKKQTKLFE